MTTPTESAPWVTVAMELLVPAVIGIALWLLRLHRREGVHDMQMSDLTKAVAANAALTPRVARMELVIGIDPVAGGGLAAQIEQLHQDLQDSARERNAQNAEILRELRAVSSQLQELQLTAVRK